MHLECTKIARFAQGGAPIEYLINLPLDELFLTIDSVNKAAEWEKSIIDKGMR